MSLRLAVHTAAVRQADQLSVHPAVYGEVQTTRSLSHRHYD